MRSIRDARRPSMSCLFRRRLMSRSDVKRTTVSGRSQNTSRDTTAGVCLPDVRSSSMSATPTMRSWHAGHSTPVELAEQRRGSRKKKRRLSEPAQRASFAASRLARVAQGTHAPAWARSSGRLSLPTFFGEAKKVGRLPGRHPGAALQDEMMTLIYSDLAPMPRNPQS